MNLKEFGTYFAKLREEAGYRSQRELAEVSGVSHSTINRIESGKHKVSPETLQILASYLSNVTYEELLYEAGYLKIETDKETYSAIVNNEGKRIVMLHDEEEEKYILMELEKYRAWREQKQRTQQNRQ